MLGAVPVFLPVHTRQHVSSTRVTHLKAMYQTREIFYKFGLCRGAISRRTSCFSAQSALNDLHGEPRKMIKHARRQAGQRASNNVREVETSRGSAVPLDLLV